MKGDLFVHETTRVASVFGRKSDVKVTFKGDGAYTNGTEIVLPSIDRTGDVSDETAAITRGYLDHEAGHIRHTDFNALAKFAGEAHSQGKKLVRTIHNALEDIWLEGRVMREYSGSRKNLVAVSDAVNRQFLEKFDPNNEEQAKRLKSTPKMCCGAISFEGRKHYGGDTCEECLDLLSDDLRAQAERWVSELDDCDCTQDVIDLAWRVEKEVYDALVPDVEGDEEIEGEDGTKDEGREGNEHDSEPDDSEPDDSEEQESGDDADTSEEDNGDGDDDGEASDPDEDGGDVSDEPEQGSEEGDDPHDGEDESRPTPDDVERDHDDVYDPSLEDAVKDAMKDDELLQDGDTDMDDTYFPASTDSDKWHHRLDAHDKYPVDPFIDFKEQSRGYHYLAKGTVAEYEALLLDTAGVTNSMRRRLERALLAKQTRDWNGGMEAGRLDTRRLVPAYSGSENVFKVQTDRQEMDTALMILVDLSGSMSGECVRLATRTCVALVEAVARTGIKFEVLGFNNLLGSVNNPNGLDPFYQWTEDASDYVYNVGGRLDGMRTRVKAHRIEPLNMYIFKAFEENLPACKGAIGAMEDCAAGCNSDGEAVALAHARLAARPEKRKVMMVLSDGLPQVGGSSPTGLKNHLRTVVSDIEASDTEIIAIGILNEAPSRFYSNYCIVNDLADLSGTALDMLSKLLLGASRSARGGASGSARGDAARRNVSKAS